MKLRIKLVILTLIAAIASSNCFAFVRYEEKMAKKLVREVKVTGFIDFIPYGYNVTNDLGKQEYRTVFKPIIDIFKEDNNLQIVYKTRKKTYEELVQDVRRGDIDVILGVYYNTEMYHGLELVYPAIINSPLTVFVLPDRVNDIKEADDLKKLKGVRLANEPYNDFVKEQLAQYDLETVDKPYDLFERLFTKKVDYILINHYMGLIEAAKLGLKDQISIAKQTIWNMPLFFGVSKFAKDRKMITKKLTEYSKDENVKQKVLDNLNAIVTDIEKQNFGVVPPTFGLENDVKKNIAPAS